MMQGVILALLESALRSALPGLAVSAAIGLFRLRDLKAKTRQTEIRGSNGHYYDLIHGVSITGSGAATDTQGRDIYFDITAFVTGRASRRAAAQVLQAELQ